MSEHPEPPPTPSAPAEKAVTPPRVGSQGHRQAERATRWLRALLALPGWVRIPLLVGVFLLYSPPLVFNLISIMNVTRTNRLRVYSYPAFVFTWPIIAWGLVFGGLKTLGVPDAVLAWAYLMLLVFTMVTMGFDFKFGGWLGIIATVTVVIVALGWWGSATDIAVFHRIRELLSGWLTLPVGWVVTLSVFLLVIYLVMMTLRRFNKRLRIHGNLVIIDTLLGKIDRNTRASYGINDDVPDVNELLLGMCSAFLLEGKGTVSSHEFKNVPGGPLVTRVIEEMLAATAVEDETDLLSDDGGNDDLGD